MSNIQDTPMDQSSTQQPVESSSWRDSLPEDIRSSGSLTKFTDVEGLARGYINAEQLIGRDKIPMPRTDDEYMEVYRRLGAPKDESGYSLNPEDYAEAGEWAMSDLSTFKGMAARAGLTNKQAEALYKDYVKIGTDVVKAQQADFEVAKNNARQALSQKYGAAYKQNMTMANKALSYLASPELIDALTDSGIANNPDFVDMLVRIAPSIVEETGIDRAAGEQVSAQQLNTQINELMSHPAFVDGTHPEHKLIVDRVTALFQKKANG